MSSFGQMFFAIKRKQMKHEKPQPETEDKK